MSVQALRSTFGPNCHWCGLPMIFDGPPDAPEAATIEHLHDATLGGIRKQSHRRLSHAVCNQTRNAFRMEAERGFKAWIEKRRGDARVAVEAVAK